MFDSDSPLLSGSPTGTSSATFLWPATGKPIFGAGYSGGSSITGGDETPTLDSPHQTQPTAFLNDRPQYGSPRFRVDEPYRTRAIRNPSPTELTEARRPYLEKLRMMVARLQTDGSQADRYAAIALSQDYVKRLWYRTDSVENEVAQYLQLIGDALKQLSQAWSASKAHALAKVVGLLADNNLAPSFRREARHYLMHAQAFKYPELPAEADINELLDLDAED